MPPGLAMHGGGQATPVPALIAASGRQIHRPVFFHVVILKGRHQPLGLDVGLGHE